LLKLYPATEIQNLPPLSSLSTKGDFSLGLDIHNQIYGWGTNAHGIFGSFTEELAINRPYKLTQKIFEKILDSKPVQVAAGSRAGIILTDKRNVVNFV
jgi:alpha-tubulin suppressor-like RCC1 family protein